MRDEIVMRQGRAGSNHLGTTNNHAIITLFFDMNADIFNLVGREIAVNRRVNDGVIPVK